MRFQDWETGGFDREAAVKMCRRGINPLVAVLLASRGIVAAEDAYSCLNEDISSLHDPFLFADMDKAAARIELAISGKERIAVYGDYDVDGMTASVLLAEYLRSRGADYEIYIPGRLDEGYGLNMPALKMLKERGVRLVVTVDCGITALAEAEYAHELGLDLIVTDHHECRERLPRAYAVVDPKRPDCMYPNKSLAGVGVCFKLICALERDSGTEEMLARYGDLAAIGTIADVMPVVGENRVIIRRGLAAINDSPRPGLRYLLRDSLSSSRRVNAATVGFALAPRLNAAGRMGKTDISVELLMTEISSEAEQLTAELSALNAERRRIETEIFEEAAEMLGKHKPDGPIVLARRGWHQGVMGIVAARIAERYFLPAIMISIDENGVGRGSCRSSGEFELYSALQSCGEVLIGYGGHEMAAGIEIAEENIEELRLRLDEYYHQSVKHKPKPVLKLDFEVNKPELLSPRNVEALESLEPFGNQNLPPALRISGATLITAVSVGDGKHSRLKLEKSGTMLDCIFFGTPACELSVTEGERVDAAFEPQINEFRGRRGVQLCLLDVRKHAEQQP